MCITVVHTVLLYKQINFPHAAEKKKKISDVTQYPKKRRCILFLFLFGPIFFYYYYVSLRLDIKVSEVKNDKLI